MKTVDYFMTPVSPYVYLGHERFRALCARAGARINLVVMDLGKVFPVSGGVPLKDRAPQRQAYRLQELARWRDFLGMPLTIQPKHFPVPPAAASTLILATLQHHGVDLALDIALGIMPYISSSIIMQLVMVLIPSLQKLQKEGEEGRKKIQQYTKYGTLLLCAVQSLAVIQLANSWSTGSGTAQAKYPGLINPAVESYFLPIAMLSITTGTILLIWLGEQITERGIGNGISLIIFAGIIGRMPEALIAMFTSDTSDALSILILIIIFIVLISLTVILTQGVRRVPLNYGKQMVGRKMVQARSQSIPFKVNSANVMPIIFASSLILFPQTIVQWLSSKGGQWAGWAVIMDYFNPFSQIWYHALFYYVIYTSLIIFFAYFYTAIQFNPQELADNLKKYGGFIPGVRPGSQNKRR